MASEEAVDWREGLTTLQRFAYMFDNKYACDVTFLVGQGEKQEAIDCHKFPLLAASPVFERIFENEVHQEISVPDLEPSGFKALMKYLYGGELKVQADNVMALMHAANKYSISGITEQCGEYLETLINEDNMCKILDASIRYGEETLKEKSLKFILENTSEFLASNDLTDLSNMALIKIIESDKMRVTNELVVYKACIEWADAECDRRQIEATAVNKREVLGDLLYNIRFPTMTQAEFAEISSQSQLLTGDECRSIFEHINLHGEDDTSCNCHLKFNKKQRSSVTLVTISRFSQSNTLPGWRTLTTHGVVNAVDFESSRPCFFAGVGLFGGTKAAYHNVSLKLLDSTGSVLSTISKIVHTDGTCTAVRVDFRRPVKISADKRYSLVASIDGQCVTYYGIQGSVRVEDHGFVFKLHDSPHAVYQNKPCDSYGAAERGQIPELHFYA